MIQPIETEYNGYRFRSRLEARWAVFFDTLGIEYQYEPEGFEFKDGTRYLPDFWLPGKEIWVEIKGQDIKWDEEKKACLLESMTGFSVIVFCGEIPQDGITFGHLLHGEGYGGPRFWGECKECHSIRLIALDDRICSCGNRMVSGTYKLRQAAKRARSARFEFGETPRPRRRRRRRR